ncbi:hypothetical protein PMAYCL1PPCAC_12823, partial [Pristionchus mayeri]
RKKKNKVLVERFACTQKKELHEIFQTIFDRQVNSSKPKDLHIRIKFETNKIEESSSDLGSYSSVSSEVAKEDRSIGGTAGVTPLPRSPVTPLAEIAVRS